LLTAFVASNVFIVLPLLMERAKELFVRHGLLDEDSESAIEIIVPVFFNFPNAGKMLTLLFVPFGAWLAGSPLEAGQYTQLFGAGIPSYFAKAQVALPFLMDLMGVPHDLFQLYIPTTIITGKFDSMVTAMNLLVFALLGGAAMGGALEVRPKRLARAALASGAGLLLAVVGTSFVMRAFEPVYTKDAELLAMNLESEPVATVVYEESVIVAAHVDSSVSALERIRRRGTLRVGYAAGSMPFTFFNAKNELVGYDVQLAESLARSLGVGIEFHPVAAGDVSSLVETGAVDVQMTVAYTSERLGRLRFSGPHIEGTMAFVVRDGRRHDFSTFEALGELGHLKIGRVGTSKLGEQELRHRAGATRIDFVRLGVPDPFFDGSLPELDGLYVAAEIGSAWSLLHPEFAVVVPRPDPLRVPGGVALRAGEVEFGDYVDGWLVIERSSGNLQRAYDYWVLGRGAVQEKRRWSILQDVLGWGSSERSGASGQSQAPPASIQGAP
jgi:ABC-type amino acid transport substrate-binding protein